jgi:hypothetical protein
VRTSWRIPILLVTALGVAIISGDGVHGFSYFQYGGVNVIWSDGQSVRYLSPTCFPDGSDEQTLMLAAMGLWNLAPASDFEYFWDVGVDYIDNYDGYNDTIVADLDPGVLGVTYMVNDGATWFDMDQVYSPYPEGAGWTLDTNPDCATITNPGSYGFSLLLVATHELGHALGLGHDPVGNEPAGTAWFIGTMNPRYPAGGPIGDNNIVELHADDRDGMRFLYPGAETLVDLATPGYASSPALGRAIPVYFTPTTVTSGQELTIRSVIENFGTVAVNNVQQGFYLSTNDTVETSDLLLGDTLWNLPVGGAYEFDAVSGMPDLVPGTYYIGTMLDDLSQVTEEYEDNNNVVYCAPLTISRASPVILPLSQQIVTCDHPFTGPTPQVAYPINMAPITWSLDNPQSGMTINPATGVISWPNPIKSPFIYELDIRATNSAGTTTMAFSLGVHQASPRIAAIPDVDLPCRQSYSGPIPSLTAPDCMNPILSWALITHPPGMTINPSSGQVSWPLSTAGDHTVTIQASNEVGSGTETWVIHGGVGGGDLSGNGTVGMEDVEPLVKVLLGQNPGAGYHPDQADTNCDGVADGRDIQPFMDLLLTVVSQGACCFADSTCTLGTPMDCFQTGGTYRGDGTTCDAWTCTGACCFYTAGCLNFTQEFCAVAGGTFQGFGTQCSQLTCPPAGKGACCLPNETCTLTTLTACNTAGGAFHGTGMSCQVVDCHTPRGACCHGNGTCTFSTQTECTTLGGTYMGNGVQCSESICLGACCYPTGGCLDLIKPDCTASGGEFQGPQTDCATYACPIEPQGACCFADQSCSVVAVSVCGYSGGEYQGDGSSCAAVDCTSAARGACCLTNESCLQVSPTACAWNGGVFIGAGTTCDEINCSLSEVGACWNPADWTCTVTSVTLCAAAGRTFEGVGTTCATTMAPEYRNDIANPSAFWAPGAGVAMADDMTLAGTARLLTYYDLGAFGTGGGTYSVTAGLYNKCPGDGGSLIAGTGMTWTAIPADDMIYLLQADLSFAPVVIPNTVWMLAAFSSVDAGWVLSEQAEVGSTQDLYGQDDPPWACDYWFGGGPGEYAGFWADIQCVPAPEPVGACCHGNNTCTEGTSAACAASAGLYMGDGTTCAGLTCNMSSMGACCNVVDWTCTVTNAAQCAAAAGKFDGVGTACVSACPEYGNDIEEITLSYNAGQPMADDITLAGTARNLTYLEIAVYGGGGGPFDIGMALYDGSPCAGGQPIPGSNVSGSGLPDGQVLPLTVSFPSPVPLPDTVWMVIEFSTTYAGWIVAEEAETGSTADYFGVAAYDSGSQQWEWTCDNQIEDPPDNPWAGFWAKLQCAGGAKAALPPADAKPVLTIGPAIRSGEPPRLVRPVKPVPQLSGE